MSFFGIGTRKINKKNKQRMNENSKQQRINEILMNDMIWRDEYLNKKQRRYNNFTKNAVTRSKLFNNNYLKRRGNRESTAKLERNREKLERNREFTALLEKNPNNNYLKWRRNKGLTAKLEKNNQGSNNHSKYLYNKYWESKRRNRELAAKLEKNPFNYGSNNYGKYVKSMNDAMKKWDHNRGIFI
jgi:hypothetical protein